MNEEQPDIDIMLFDRVTVKLADTDEVKVSGWIPTPSRRGISKGILLTVETDSRWEKRPIRAELFLPEGNRLLDDFGRLFVRVPKRTTIPQYGMVDIEVTPYSTK